MFNPIIYSYLELDTIDYTPTLWTAETARREPSSSSLNGISPNKNLCEVE
jgi:hypothetical protein